MRASCVRKDRENKQVEEEEKGEEEEENVLEFLTLQDLSLVGLFTAVRTFERDERVTRYR